MKKRGMIMKVNVVEHHESISEESARRLEELAAYMETVKPSTFDMDMFSFAGDGLLRRFAKAHEIDESALDNFDFPVCADTLKEPCGTTCCIAGHQVIRKGFCLVDTSVFRSVKFDKKTNEFKGSGLKGDVEQVASQQLGITLGQARLLFYDDVWPTNEAGRPLFPSTPKGAAKRIRHLIITGQ
jgi:hypothetical protein